MISSFIQRTAARVFCERPLPMRSRTPIISFSFDDFPRSALHTAGAILERHQLKGTYYVSFGLMGGYSPTGEMFTSADLTLLLERGHELGCHTFDHCHSWDTSTRTFEGSILANRAVLERLAPGRSFRTFSYPSSPPRPLTKRATARHFGSARGGGQTINRGQADLNYLGAYFLEKCGGRPEAPKAMIEWNRRERGWLIFATHDVSQSPTPYGCTPEFFEDIVDSACASGATILPVGAAVELLTARHAGLSAL